MQFFSNFLNLFVFVRNCKFCISSLFETANSVFTFFEKTQNQQNTISELKFRTYADKTLNGNTLINEEQNLLNALKNTISFMKFRLTAKLNNTQLKKGKEKVKQIIKAKHRPTSRTRENDKTKTNPK